MSMGLFEKYKFPDMYTSPELQDATQRLVAAARKNGVILGLFLFGTARVGEPRQGLPVRQRRQRSPPHPHAGRCLREGHRERVEGAGQGVVTPPVESALAATSTE
jgi:hypothetical protein